MPSGIPRNYFRGQIYKFFSFFFVFYCFLFYLKIKDTQKLSSQRLFNIKKLRKYVKEGKNSKPLYIRYFLGQERYEIYRQEYHILVFSKILGIYQVFSVYAFRIFF